MDAPITDATIPFEDPSSPVPPSENGAFVDPSVDSGISAPPIDFANMSPEEAMWRNDIESNLQKVKVKGEQFQNQIHLDEEELNLVRKNIMQELFQLMIDSGVDPNNLESLQAFFDELEQSNPDLKQMFEIGIDAIEGTPGQGSSLTPIDENPPNPSRPPVPEEEQTLSN